MLIRALPILIIAFLVSVAAASFAETQAEPAWGDTPAFPHQAMQNPSEPPMVIAAAVRSGEMEAAARAIASRQPGLGLGATHSAPFPVFGDDNHKAAHPDLSGVRLAMSFYPDEREFVRNDPEMDRMFSGVVQIECRYNNGRQAYYGTGSVIERDLVLTAAHVVYRKTPTKDKILRNCRVLTGDRNDRDGWDEQVSYKIRAVYTDEPLFHEDGVMASTGEKVIQDGKDWAILRIAGDFPKEIGTLKIFHDYDPNHDSIWLGLAHVSYGIDDALYRGQRQPEKSCEVIDHFRVSDGYIVRHDCDNFIGSSGGPLFKMNKENGEWVPYIAGIHTGSSDSKGVHNYKNPAPKASRDGPFNGGLYLKGSLLDGIRKYRGY